MGMGAGPRPSRIAGVLVATVALCGAVSCVRPPAASRAITDCTLLSADHVLRADVTGLPRHPSSDAWVASIGVGRGVHADFGSGTWNGGPIGIPFTTATAATPKVSVSFEYASESDPGPWPIPAGAPIEGGPASAGDRHVLVVNQSDCRLHELFAARPVGRGWVAGSGASWDLQSTALRPAGWTSADAAGLPILPLLVRYDEIVAGRIDHMIRFTAPRTQRSFSWPARHQAGASTDPTLAPMGSVFRLKPGTDISRFSGAARVVAEAMLRHGVILADNGSPWYISGAPDPRWDNDVLHQLDVLVGSDFEAVDISSLMISPDSAQRRT